MSKADYLRVHIIILIYFKYHNGVELRIPLQEIQTLPTALSPGLKHTDPLALLSARDLGGDRRVREGHGWKVCEGAPADSSISFNFIQGAALCARGLARTECLTP